MSPKLLPSNFLDLGLIKDKLWAIKRRPSCVMCSHISRGILLICYVSLIFPVIPQRDIIKVPQSQIIRRLGNHTGYPKPHIWNASRFTPFEVLCFLNCLKSIINVLWITTLLQGMNMSKQIRASIFKELPTSSLIVSQSLYNQVPSCWEGLTSMFLSSSGIYVR